MSMENRIFMHLLQINRLLEYNFGENLKKWDLTFSQAHVLKTLYVNQGQATQKEIEKQLGVSHPTVSGLIHRLEKNGYVTSEIDKRDKRNRIVTLTDRAMEHRAVVMEGRKKIENLLLSDFSPAEITELDSLLEHLLLNLTENREYFETNTFPMLASLMNTKSKQGLES